MNLPKFDQFPDSQLFLNDKGFEINKTYFPNKVKLFSVELWQILTGITIVLTMASMLIYFSDLRPKAFETSFVNLGQVKTSLFNHQTQLQSWFEGYDKAGVVSATLKESCYSDIENVNTNESFYDSISQELIEYDKKFLIIDEDFKKNQSSDLFKDSNVQEYFFSIERYQTFIDSYFQRQEIFYNETIKLKKLASKVCKSKITDSDENLANLKKSLDSFPTKTLLDYQALLDDSSEFYDSSKKIFEKLKNKSLNRESDGELIATFREKFVSIFKASFDFESEKKELTRLIEETDSQAQKLENWEKEFAKNNQYLEKYLVLLKKSE